MGAKMEFAQGQNYTQTAGRVGRTPKKNYDCLMSFLLPSTALQGVAVGGSVRAAIAEDSVSE